MKPAALTRTGRAGLTWWHLAQPRLPSPTIEKVPEARLGRTVRQPIKLRRFSPSRENAEVLGGPKPVAHRQMRDRWRLDGRKVVRRLSRPTGGNAAGEEDLERASRVSHGADRVSEEAVSAGARHAKRRL